MADCETKYWYVAYTKRQQEKKIYKYLTDRGFVCYLPMKLIPTTQGTYADADTTTKPTLILHGLIFLNINTAEYQTITHDKSINIYFITDQQTKQPVEVPEKQMHDFMFMLRNQQYICELSGVDAKRIKQGQRIRVIDGPLKGIEGEFIRIGGDRRVMIRVGEIISITTIFIHPKFLQKIQ